jgi:hypothetical protein
MMIGPRLIGLLGGLVFGLVLVWQGVGDAFIVLALATAGATIGFLVWIVGRVTNGEIDLNALRDLIAAISSGRTRD